MFFLIDMAERLYHKWENSQISSRFKLLKRFFQAKYKDILKTAWIQFKSNVEIKEIITEKIKLQAYLGNIIKENETLEQLKNINSDETSKNHRNQPTKSKSFVSQQTQNESKSVMNFTKQKESERIFEKLHDDAKIKKEGRELNEEIRKQQETQYCTFKPKVKARHSSINYGHAGDVYNRLAETNKTRLIQLYEEQKEMNETRNCTFHPEILNNANTRGSVPAKEVYSRLHKEAEIKEKIRQSKQIENKDKELKGCTFNPAINYGTAKVNSDPKNERFEELFQKHDASIRNLAKKIIEREEEQLRECSFKPKIASQKNRGLSREKSDVPRYEKLYQKHIEKERILEMKRQEIANEEKKMRQFISVSKKKINATSTKINKENNSICFERMFNVNELYKKNKELLLKKIMKVLLLLLIL